MRRMMFGLLTCLIFVGLGCSDWTGSHHDPGYLPAAGKYEPPAQPAPRLSVAVPLVAVEKPIGLAPDVDAQAAASDELFSLLDSSNRFILTERLRLTQLLSAQGLGDMIEPGRLVHPAPVHGFDYLMFGRISDLSIKREPDPNQVSVVGVERSLHLGSGWRPKLIVDGSVDMMLVDAHTGAVAVSEKNQFHHMAPPQDLGLQLTADELLNSPQVQLNAPDTHRIFRMMLDDALRPMLPRLDRWAAALPQAHESMATTGPINPLGVQATTRPSQQSPTAFLICPECGARVSADEEFCPNCGHKLR